MHCWEMKPEVFIETSLKGFAMNVYQMCLLCTLSYSLNADPNKSVSKKEAVNLEDVFCMSQY